MNKKSTPTVWDIEPEATEPVRPEKTTAKTPVRSEARSSAKSETRSDSRSEAIAVYDSGFDMEGLMTDFPTAGELQKFVYDQTGIVLNLKGRSNRMKYQIALDTLNGITPPKEFVGTENPYLDRNEIVPEDPLPLPPANDPELKNAGDLVTRFGTNTFPHPDPEWKAQDIKANVVFRKYSSGIITYEILGPIAKKAVGTKINKFGAKQPERITWIDPRTGEQVIRRSNGTYTPLGTRLRAFMQRQRVNKSNQWDIWVDRDFIANDQIITDNPWAN